MKTRPEKPTPSPESNRARLRAATRRRGAVIVMAAVCLIALFGVLAIALDGGSLLSERRHAQVTADAAALAAAGDLYKNYLTYGGKDTAGTAKQAALDVANGNGYTNDGTTSTVTVNIAPTSGSFSGQDGYAEVIVESKQQRGFSAVFGQGNVSVRGRAVARGRQSTFKRGLILLSPTATDSLQVSGNGTINIKNGVVIVDSKAAIAFQSSGNGKITADSFEITGNYQKSGSAIINGAIHTGVTPTPDPLASLAVPNLADYTVRANSQTSVSSDTAKTLSPGIYKGGISMSGNGAVTLLPGVYIMQGGGFAISGNGDVTGNGVMIYNMVGSGGDHGQVLISGNGTVTLTPPTSGSFQGIGIYQERSQTDRVQISGNGLVQISGVVYAKSANTQLSGNGVSAVDTLGGTYVCDTMQVSGDGLFNVDLGANTPPGTPQFSLVE